MLAVAIPDVFTRLQQSMYELIHQENGAVVKQFNMTTRISIKPNPFSTTITIEITCDSSKHIVVRMCDYEGKIIKMFGWYLMRGTNVTAIQELRQISTGEYRVDVMDQDGGLLYSSTVSKEK
jgi:hypothetical protein